MWSMTLTPVDTGMVVLESGGGRRCPTPHRVQVPGGTRRPIRDNRVPSRQTPSNSVRRSRLLVHSRHTIGAVLALPLVRQHTCSGFRSGPYLVVILWPGKMRSGLARKFWFWSPGLASRRRYRGRGRSWTGCRRVGWCTRRWGLLTEHATSASGAAMRGRRRLTRRPQAPDGAMRKRPQLVDQLDGIRCQWVVPVRRDRCLSRSEMLAGDVLDRMRCVVPVFLRGRAFPLVAGLLPHATHHLIMPLLAPTRTGCSLLDKRWQSRSPTTHSMCTSPSPPTQAHSTASTNSPKHCTPE